MIDALMLTLLLQVRLQSPSCIAGEGWSFMVQTPQQGKPVPWEETTDAPPLAPRAAIRSARSLLNRMACKDTDAWEVDQVALRPVPGERQIWFYVVRLVSPLRPKAAVGSVLRRSIEIPVLMDGT